MSEYGFCSSHPPHGQQRVWLLYSAGTIIATGLLDNTTVSFMYTATINQLDFLISNVYKSQAYSAVLILPTKTTVHTSS